MKTSLTVQPTGENPTEFVPVVGGGETTSALSLLSAAYLLMWLCLMGYIWLTWQRHRRLSARLDAVERQFNAQSPNRDDV